MADAKLSLDPHGKDFVLKRTSESGETVEIILSAMDVLTLAQSAQRLKDHILAQQSRSGVSMGVHMPVAQVSLNTDIHVHEILLGLIDGNGAEQRFALPLEVAKPLAERLPVRIAEIEAVIPTRTRQ